MARRDHVTLALIGLSIFWSVPTLAAGLHGRYCEALLTHEKLYAGVIEIDQDGTVISETNDEDSGKAYDRDAPEMGEQISEGEVERREQEDILRRMPQPELQIVPVTETPKREIPPWIPNLDISKLPPFGTPERNPAKKLPN